MTISEWLGNARAYIAPLDAELIAADAFGVSRAQVLAHPEWIANPQELDLMLARRASGEPMAYIRGRQEFFGREFFVSQDVLIPRPETEVLVETILAESVTGRAIDVGTGSGAIAVTLAIENSDLSLAAIDESIAALLVAQKNAAALGAQVALLCGDCLTPVCRGWDAVVSNPPYVAHGDPRLEASVADWEPAAALYADDGGIAFIENLVRQSADVLRPGGLLAFEFGIGQEQAAIDLLVGWDNVRVVADLAGISRVALARRSYGN